MTLLFAALLSISLGWLIYGTEEHSTKIFLAVLSTSLVGIYVLMFNEFQSSITIDQYSIRYQSSFYTRELLLTEIKGYQEIKDATYLIPLIKGKRSINVSGYRVNGVELIEWVEGNFKNLDQHEARQVHLETLTKEEARENRLKVKKAKTFILRFNLASFFIVFFSYISRHDMRLLPLVLLILLLSLLFTVYRYKGIITLNEPQNPKYPDAGLATMICSIGIFACSLDAHYVTTAKVWPMVLLLTALLTGLLWYICRDFSLKTGTRIFIMIIYPLFFLAASWGSVVFLNGGLDSSKPQSYSADIVEKHIRKGKRTNYLLRLAPWGPVNEIKEIRVSREFYESVETNDHLEINLYQGALGIPWYKTMNKIRWDMKK
ncbi:hypothetical protein [Chitinophaga barathri]|nr:hypothetical protein [Chitinophaga barathri]